MECLPSFSNRTIWNFEENALSIECRAAVAAGRCVVDLTRSNPTICGFDYGNDLLSSLQHEAALQYVPQSFGLDTARKAVARYYSAHKASIAPEHICLTTSTSEAYSFLFRLLCNPGDEVLVARPSYPLFEYLAQLNDVSLREYPLHYDPNADANHGWLIDLVALESAITPLCRAIVLVHPNNPTGNYVSSDERLALESVCIRHGLALIVDEVFLDYALNVDMRESFGTVTRGCLTFILSGISKVCALPQMKASWVAVMGPDHRVAEALARLEMIADTFLSMNTPVQLSLPKWLKDRGSIQTQILHRMRMNLAALDTRLVGTLAQRLQMQGGWTTVVRVPRTIGDLPFAMAALVRGVLVQPGEFYGLTEGRVVLSLLTPVEEWVKGLALLPL